MPAQKRSLHDNHQHEEDDEEPEQQQQVLLPPNNAKQSRREHNNLQQDGVDEAEEDEEEEEEEEEETQGQQEDMEVDEDRHDDDSEGTPSSNSEEKPEYVFVELPDIRKDVQCPICLGIIKKTRTVMECLHRFCRECIDKSMRLGNNECPACRTHCASRRSLRDDPNYDALIAAIYPDIDKYEEEELAFHEEERTRNKQIQASIAQIFQRQSEALVKRRTPGKDHTFSTRLQRNARSGQSRRRRIVRGAEPHGSEDIEDENDDNGGKESSSNDERTTEVRQRRRKRRSGTRASQPSSSAANSDGGCIDNDSEVGRESRGISPGLVWNPEMLAWGRGGVRSNTRHGNASNGHSKSSRVARLNKLVEYLRSLQENSDELNIHLMLVSLDKQNAPSLQQLYLCCRPSLSVTQLCEYVSKQTPLEAEEVEILMIKQQIDANTGHHTLNPSIDQVQILGGQETVAGLRVKYTLSQGHLILAYRGKQNSSISVKAE